jgi:hypothetical protein
MIALTELPRQLDAIVYAAEKLGYNVREVERRIDSVRTVAHPDGGASAGTIRQHIINMRGWDMPPQLATHTFLDLQLERLIDMLASDEQRAEEREIAARLVTDFDDWFDVQHQGGRGVTW